MTKLKVYAGNQETAASLPTAWQPRPEQCLKVLGQRLALKLDAEGLQLELGVSFLLGPALAQLDKLYSRLDDLSVAGLPLRHQPPAASRCRDC